MTEKNTKSSRIVNVFGDIEDEMATEFIDEMLELSFESPSKEITVYINSEGGSMYSMFAMHDIMRKLTNPIHTIGIGRVMSAAVLLMAAGDKRSITPNTHVMVHEPSYFGPENKVGQWERELDHLKVLKNEMYQLLASYTGQTTEKIELDLNAQDKYISAKEAVEYGLTDNIIKLYPKAGKPKS